MKVIPGARPVVILDSQEAVDWVSGTSDARSEVEQLARATGVPVAVRANIGASLGIVWPNGVASNIASDRVKEQVRQEFKVEKEQL